jgi:glycosyltransferase involved in cell wall biosynthesis
MVNTRYSIVVPVYRNQDCIPDLLSALSGLNKQLERRLELIFVVDGSPDQSKETLQRMLPSFGLRAKVILLSRNFGAFAAIQCGLEVADGDFIGVMAADLQEPPGLMIDFFNALENGDIDVAFGQRISRADPLLSKLASGLFWRTYKKLVQPDVPTGGVDVFALTRSFRDRLVQLNEANSSLLGLLFWLGGRRKFIPYERQARVHGKSAWTFGKKVSYLLDSVFAFTDLPVRLLMLLGASGLILAAVLSAIIFFMHMAGSVSVPGYAGSMLTILFFGALNTFGIGVVGNYAWRAYENTKKRPSHVIITEESFSGDQA